jgi:hypothetical protein
MRTLALASMRINAYARSQRALGPLLGTLVLAGIAHAGGQASPQQAYGFSAALLFGVLAWQTKLILDTEPDEQRMIARVSIGSAPKEAVAGILAALACAVPIVLVGLFAPALLRALDLERTNLLAALALGLLIHALAVFAGLGVGALASRAVVPATGWAALILVGAPVLVLVLGSRTSPVAHLLVPQFFGLAKLGPDDAAGTATLTAHALAWAAILLAWYAFLRRTRP